MRRFGSFLAIALLTLSGQAFAQIELNDGETIGLEISAIAEGSAQLDTRFFFDTPADATRFEIFLEPGSAPNNVDIFLRANSEYSNIASLNDLIQASDYYAGNFENTDRITVERYQTPFPQGIRWFVAVLVRGGDGGNVGLGLNVTRPGGNIADSRPLPGQFAIDFINTEADPDCDIGPWSDQTPFTGVGGNPGPTLGDARRRAFERAVEIVGASFDSSIPIRIAACWEAQGGTATSATVAVGAPDSGFANFPGIRNGNTVYAKSVVERLSGTEFCSVIGPLGGDEACGTADLRIRFNTDIDGSALGSADFYYGLNPNARQGNDVDFVAVAVHELVHGMGFTTFLDEDGSLRSGEDDLLDLGLVDPFFAALSFNDAGTITPLAELPDNAARSDAVISVSGLEWTGPEASINLMNDLADVGPGNLRMYAPDPYEPGSSVSHVDLRYCDLMLPVNVDGCPEGFRELGLSQPMLNQIGWSSGPNFSPYLGLMFDRARGGHGFEIQFAGFDAQSRPIYVLTFYSYETNGGAPEWFQAVGYVENGVFYGDPALGAGDGLQEYDYDDTRPSPPQRAVSNHRGQVVLSFNRPLEHPACNDGIDRSSAELLIPMQWTIDGQVDEWCMEPLVPTSTRPATDFGGLWFAGVDDQGWGFSIENFNGSLFVLVYVYAADGSAVWFFGLADGFTPGEALTMPLFQREGFSRLLTERGFTDTEAGTITILLVEPSDRLDAGNRVTIDVDYLGAEGGGWRRTDVPIQRLTLPR